MDPDVALNNLRGALHRFNSATTDNDATDAADEIVTAAEALDQWLSQGGALPKEWTR